MKISNYIKIYIIITLLIIIFSVFLCVLLMEPEEYAYAEKTTDFKIIDHVNGGNGDGDMLYINQKNWDERTVMENLINSGSVKETTSELTFTLTAVDNIIVTSNTGKKYVYNTNYSVGDSAHDAIIFLFGSNDKTNTYLVTLSKFNNTTSGTVNSNYLKGNLVSADYGFTRNGSTTYSKTVQKNYNYYWCVVAYQWQGKATNGNKYMVMGITGCYTADYDRPVVNFGYQAQKDGIYYVRNVTTISFSDNNFSALYYQAPGSSSYYSTSSTSYTIQSEGTWSFYAVDSVGYQSDTYSIVADFTAPTGTLSGVTNGGITNTNVSFNFSKDTAQYRKNNTGSWISFSSGTVFSEEGVYAIKMKDIPGNETNYSFEIDKTAPTGTLTGIVGQNNYTNQNVSFTWSDSRASATLNGSNYSKGATISAEREHTIILRDTAGNSTSYTFVIDKTAPTGTLSGIVGEDNYTNRNVSFNWSDTRAAAKLNGNNYALDEIISDEGNYTVVLTDWATNSTTYTFAIDKTAPTGTLAGVVGQNNYTNQDVTFSWDDELAAAKLNNKKYEISSVVSEPGEYTIVLKDKATNETTYTFVIDKTAPTGTLSGVVGIDNYTNKNVSFSWNDSLAAATLNGSSYTKGDEITAENSYELILTDWATNQTVYTFCIDKTAPTGSLTGIVGQNNYTNQNVSFTWSDNLATAKINGSEYLNNTTISAENSYTLILKDKATNETTYTFVIDKTAPTGSFSGIVGEDNYTNRNVSFNWSDTKASATLNGNNYALDEIVSDEGNYTVVLTDWATNSTTYTFVIDKTAPTGSFSGISGINNNTNTSASFTWEDIRATARINGEEYTKENIISEDGNYTIILKDKATNETTYELCIDRVAPTGSFSGITNQEYMITNKNVSFSWNDPKATAKLDDQSYSKDTKITNESVYELVLTDWAGNFTIYTFEIDLTKPVVLYNAGDIQDRNYTKKNFTLSLNKAIDTLYVAYKNSYNYEAVEQNTTFEEQGYYYVYGKDRAGNESEKYIVYYQMINDFGNANQIFNQYKKTTWYSVSLPSYIFKATGTLPSVAGTYYFENYDDALYWSKQQEYTYRVTQSPAGYIYISATNESVSQIYADEETLDVVLSKYARTYISSQNIYQNIDVRFSGTIMNSAGIKDPEALTENSIELPTVLETMQSSNLYLCKSTYSFSRLNGLYVDPTITITYLSNGTTLAADGFTGDISFGKKLEEYLEQNEAKKQGYYLVEEKDLCGNYQSYIIYLDFETPTIVADATFGDDTIKTINFTADEVDLHDGTYYFISLELKSIFDNIDSFLCCHIRGSKYNAWLTADDALMTLSQETTGEGAYIITCYDRSYNALTFSVYIAGNAPKWNYSGINSDKLTLRFSTNDDYNAFTALSISIIDYEGNPQILTEDSEGTLINFTTLRYTFFEGGKYTATVTDLYKRTITFSPIFFLNGLPQGSFKGVNDGEATNKDVYFYYQKGYQVIVYTLDEERNKTVFSDYTITYATASLTYTLSIEAANATNGTYLIFLYAEGNMASFIEYTFTIDTILAEYSLLSSSGEDLTSTYSTNEGFYLDWSEDNVSVKYTLDGTLYSRYKQGQIINVDGIYTLTITDYVGNSENIVVCVDTSVNYTINGTYTNFGGTLYAKSDIQVVMNEAYTSFLILADNGVTVYDGYITEEGNYIVFIEDNYKNTEKIYVSIDKTAPTGTLEGVENKGTTNGNVNITWNEDEVYKAVQYNKYNSIVGSVNPGSQFKNDGYYKIILSDKAGNETTYEFTIDKAVSYQTDIVNKQITTTAVSFAFSEELKTIKVTNNGAEIKEATSYKDLGNYTLYAEDLYGNSIDYEFTIINNISKAIDLALYQGQTLSLAMLNGEEYIPAYENGLYEFRETGAYQVSVYDTNQKITYSMNFNVDTIAPTIDFEQTTAYAVNLGIINKKNVTAALYKDGEATKFDENSQITEPGNYVLVLTDEYGNETTYEFTIKYHLNTMSIVLIGLGIVVLIVILVLIIRSRKVKAA